MLACYICGRLILSVHWVLWSVLDLLDLFWTFGRLPRVVLIGSSPAEVLVLSTHIFYLQYFSLFQWICSSCWDRLDCAIEFRIHLVFVIYKYSGDKSGKWITAITRITCALNGISWSSFNTYALRKAIHPISALWIIQKLTLISIRFP